MLKYLHYKFDHIPKTDILYEVFSFVLLCTRFLKCRSCLSFPEICLPNEQARMEILKIHAAPIAKHGEIGMDSSIKNTGGEERLGITPAIEFNYE